MHRIHPAAPALALTTALAGTPALAAPDVVASIKPVHSLVSAVMDGVGTPVLLVEGAASPHGYDLRPSKAAALQDADLVFWVGPDMETFLDGTVATLAADATDVALMAIDGVTLLDVREGGAFEEHDDDHGHGDHGHGDHGHDDHGHDDHEAAGHGDDDGQVHDAHVWLDTQNAALFVGAIERALSAADPDNAQTYARNAAATLDRLSSLEADITGRLASFEETGFIVFHDAYQYFENRFGLRSAGSITVNPEIMPGPERLRDIQTRIEELGATCVFAEPQFEPKLIDVVIEGTEARGGVLDPLGAALADGPDLYFALLDAMATSFETCLARTG